MRDPILITGAARSGTSLVTGIIDICGGFGGILTGSTPHNKKGQYENTHIRDEVTKPYLLSMGADKLGQRPLPHINFLIPYPSLRSKIREIFTGQGYIEGAWYYKGAKLCLIWPIWNIAFPKARWLIVRRDPKDNADSCLRTSFMRAYKTIEGWLEWHAVHMKRFEEMKQECKDVTEVWAEDIVKGNFIAIKNFVDNTEGLVWKEEEVVAFISPSLWKEGK